MVQISSKPLGPSERIGFQFSLTLWLFNIAMENGPSMDDLPIFTY
jgi:hypothetical protein